MGWESLEPPIDLMNKNYASEDHIGLGVILNLVLTRQRKNLNINIIIHISNGYI